MRYSLFSRFLPASSPNKKGGVGSVQNGIPSALPDLRLLANDGNGEFRYVRIKIEVSNIEHKHSFAVHSYQRHC